MNASRQAFLSLRVRGRARRAFWSTELHYLIRVCRENPRGILVLVYNRHAATEIRQRLFKLLGSDARGVTVLTCHGLAMRLVGASFARDADKVDIDPRRFDEVLRQAVDLLQGKGLSKEEAEAQRDTLTDGYRWILVDEYQDVGPGEYDLIASVAGRSIQDRDSRLSLFAVGDDDQNIYAFAGASVEYIRRFERGLQGSATFIWSRTIGPRQTSSTRPAA